MPAMQFAGSPFRGHGPLLLIHPGYALDLGAATGL